MKNVARNQIRSLPIPLASLKEQKQIVIKPEELLTVCDQLQTRLQQAKKPQLSLAEGITDQVLKG